MRCDSLNAVMKGFTRVAVARNTTSRTTSGSMITHSSAWKPPIDGPSIRSMCLMPRCLRTRISAFTMSRTVVRGKSKKYGRPVAGFTIAGPVAP